MNKRTNLKTWVVVSVFLLAMEATATGRTIYVDPNAVGANNGSSWGNAYNYLQDALTDARSAGVPTEIRVAGGIYTPDKDSAMPNGTGDRTAAFQLINGLAIYGGFPSGGGTWEQRDPNLYETILSGDLNGDDGPNSANNSENSYHVVISNATDSTAVLDGFIVTAGNANGPYYPDYLGAGMLNVGGSLTITNCTFGRNCASSYGGGMWNGASSPMVTNCTFISNSAELGGGMHNYNSSPTLTNCTFSGNSAHVHGGGMSNSSASPTVTSCTFTGNRAEHLGGGINSYGNSSPTVSACMFSGNSAAGGGGMFNGSGSTTVSDSIFSGNSSTNNGGGIFDMSDSLTVINCTFRRNNASSFGGGMFNYNSSATLINCTFSGNSARYGGGMLNWGTSPTLSNCTFAANSAPMGNALACDSYHQEYPSDLQITNCILWDGGSEIWNNDGSTIRITYSDIQGAQTAVYDPCEGLVWGDGNIDADPCFADPNNGDYHLQSQAGRWDTNEGRWTKDDVTSPCIDAGNPGCPLGDEPEDVNNIRINMGAYGGTAEASKTPANWRSIADLTNDWTVDFNDLKVFVDYWLETGECIPSDLNRSQSVDFSDFAIFGRQWSDKSVAEPGMTYQIDDCNMEAGLSWPLAADSNQPRFSVWVEGRYIHFEDMMYANCCPEELGLEKEINGNQITLYEIGYGGLCDCMCYFPITATLGPFEDGTYTVEVFDNYGQSLGVVEVTIGGPSIAYQIEDCDPAASGLFAAEEVGQTRFSAVVEGRYIHFEDMMTANCCPDELGLEMTVEDNLITIYETEYTPGGCFCICDYPVTATLGPFEPGTYILDVYEDWGGFIGSTVVTIGLVE